jgi:hypothetical protein
MCVCEKKSQLQVSRHKDDALILHNNPIEPQYVRSIKRSSERGDNTVCIPPEVQQVSNVCVKVDGKEMNGLIHQLMLSKYRV